MFLLFFFEVVVPQLEAADFGEHFVGARIGVDHDAFVEVLNPETELTNTEPEGISWLGIGSKVSLVVVDQQLGELGWFEGLAGHLKIDDLHVVGHSVFFGDVGFGSGHDRLSLSKFNASFKGIVSRLDVIRMVPGTIEYLQFDFLGQI